jgi:hypothetical protein
MSEVETEAVETEEVTPPADDAAESDKPESPSATAKAEAAAESPSDDAEADGESEPKEWVNLVGKFEGDKEKIGKEFWRYANSNAALAKSNADLAKKVKDLEAKVAAPAAPKDEPEPTKPAADHPSIQKLESTITALEEAQASLQSRGASKFTELQAQEKAIAKLEARIEDQGDLADESLKDRLDAAQRHRGVLAEQLMDLKDRFLEKKDRLEDAKSRREDVRAEAETESQRQKEQQAKEAEFRTEYPQRIDAMSTTMADELGVDSDPEIRQDLWETVNTKLMAKMFALGKGVEITATDEHALVKGYVERFVKTHGFASKKNFAGTSKEKAKVSQRITPGQPLVPKRTHNLPPGLVDDAVAKDPKLMAARQRMERFSTRIGA